MWRVPSKIVGESKKWHKVSQEVQHNGASDYENTIEDENIADGNIFCLEIVTNYQKYINKKPTIHYFYFNLQGAFITVPDM
ncbi:MAG: hypothetical protein F6K55_03045 [Moorea sp. SIO4A3]|nr:hypothetical protein [Moorena sp. SIO4A3]